MELDLENEFADRAYPILASLVTPRPIAFVTTLSADGYVNAAPFSFFNLLGSDPPICAFAPGDRDDGTPKDTALNVRSTHEFVVNLVDEAIRAQKTRESEDHPGNWRRQRDYAETAGWRNGAIRDMGAIRIVPHHRPDAHVCLEPRIPPGTAMPLPVSSNVGTESVVSGVCLHFRVGRTFALGSARS